MTTKILCEKKGWDRGYSGLYDTVYTGVYKYIYKCTRIGQENKDAEKREYEESVSRWFWLHEFSTVYAPMCGLLWFHKETIVWLAGEVTLSLHTSIILAT